MTLIQSCLRARRGWPRAEGDDGSYNGSSEKNIFLKYTCLTYRSCCGRARGRGGRKKRKSRYSTSRTWYASLTSPPAATKIALHRGRRCRRSRRVSKSYRARKRVKSLYVFTRRNWVPPVIYRDLQDRLKKDREFLSHRLDPAMPIDSAVFDATMGETNRFFNPELSPLFDVSPRILESVSNKFHFLSNVFSSFTKYTEKYVAQFCIFFYICASFRCLFADFLW